jgi:hypothetical protein
MFQTIVLVLRILYRLRFLSEQSTFDAATFSYAFPLLSHILVTGGVIGGEEDDPVEQAALTVEIFKYHSVECKYLQILLRTVLIMSQSPAILIPDYKSLISSFTPLDNSLAFEKMHRQL